MTTEWRPVTSRRQAIYVAFDADEDRWAYGYMKGWTANPNMDFTFSDAHELNVLTDRAGEERVKRQLRGRFAGARLFLLLVGKKTHSLYRYVRWEIEFAMDERLPIIVANLNKKREVDPLLCPPILRKALAVHVSFNEAIIRHAITDWPRHHAALLGNDDGPRWYSPDVYRNLDL